MMFPSDTQAWRSFTCSSKFCILLLCFFCSTLFFSRLQVMCFIHKSILLHPVPELCQHSWVSWTWLAFPSFTIGLMCLGQIFLIFYRYDGGWMGLWFEGNIIAKITCVNQCSCWWH
jgi:hypothetical protein